MHVKVRPAGAPPDEWQMRDASDADLVEAAQRDPAAFIGLYDRYFPVIYGYVRLRTVDEATCEDVTSQVFTTALARIHTLRAGGNIRSWLLTVAHNAIHDLYRRREGSHGWEETVTVLADPSPSPEEQTLAKERAMELRAVLMTLGPDQQHLLALRYGAGLSFGEIAHLVGKNPIAIRVNVHRILTGLRRRYRS